MSNAQDIVLCNRGEAFGEVRVESKAHAKRLVHTQMLGTFADTLML